MDRSWRIVLRTVAGTGLVALCLALACATERGTEPTPPDYRLYVGMEGEGDLVFAVDVARDSVIDSTAARGDEMKEPIELQELRTLKTIHEPRQLEKMAAICHIAWGQFGQWWMMACDRDEVEWEGYLHLRRN